MSAEEIDQLLERTTFCPFVPPYINCDGYLLGYQYNDLKHKIDSFEVKDSDVWVTSYPKTGTTWTQEMVWLIVNDLNFEEAKHPLPQRFPYIEIETLVDWQVKRKLGLNVPFSYLNSIEATNSLKSNPRCIKTHLPWDLLPKTIINKERKPKIIHVVRNPKDTCVSYYHHHVLLQYFKGTFENFCTLFLNDKVIYSPYWKVIESYWEQRNEPNVLIIKYEDMKTDLKSVVLKVASFLGKTIPDDKMEKLLDHLSFKSMKNNKFVNSQPSENITDSNAQFIRKGIIGDYKNIMNPEMIEKFDKWIDERNKIGITF